MKEYEKLSDYAKRMGLKYQSVWKQYKEGRLPQVEKINGSLFVPIEPEKEFSQYNRVVTYARVESTQSKKECEAQSQRLSHFCADHRWIVVNQLTEVSSEITDERKKLWSVFLSDDWDTLVIENKDVLSKWELSFFEVLNKEKGKELIITQHA